MRKRITHDAVVSLHEPPKALVPTDDCSRPKSTYFHRFFRIVTALVALAVITFSGLNRPIDIHTRVAESSPEDPVDMTTVRPLLVLHIGPHKTGTSTIQCDLAYYRYLLHNNTNASYTFLGRTYRPCRIHTQDTGYNLDTQGTRDLIDCLDNHQPNEIRCNEQKIWKNFEELLRRLASQGHNVVISDEAFSRMKATDDSLQLLFSTLSQHFQVNVVITYRRYYEWLLSMYSQQNKDKALGNWPQDGGEPIPAFSQAHRAKKGKYNYYEATMQANLHPVEYLSKLWSNYSSSLVVFNMHQPGDLTENFVSQVMPGAKEAFERRPQPRQKPERRNPSVSYLFDYDMLAVVAREKGLLPKDLQRKVFAKKIGEQLHQVLLSSSPNATTVRDVPRVCLSPSELDKLLNESLSFESRLFPQQSSEAYGDHQSGFQRAVESHKFCNLDVTTLIQDESVTKFLQGLTS